MAQYTTFRVGGKVEALCFIETLNDLRAVVCYVTEEGIPYLVVGRGSNLLVRDGGFKGVVFMLRGNLASIEKSGKTEGMIVSGGGVTIVELLNYCREKGLGGLEFLAGIPGTVGGAVAMNAGAWGKDIGSRVQQVQMITEHGELVTRERSELLFSYRALSIPEGTVITKVRFELDRERSDIVAARMAGYLKERKARQPLEYPSGGSVFKNPPDDYAGRLIEMAGLKGKKIGGAMISPKHGNFIVNTGGAKAEDILALMNLAQRKVRKAAGIELELEIKVVGE
jgi:UDP-N-acetylmuramate dehydrogenase